MATHEVTDFFFDFGKFNHFVRIVVVNTAGPNGNKAKFVQTYSAVFICSQNLDASVGIIRVDEAQPATTYPKWFCFFQPNHFYFAKPRFPVLIRILKENKLSFPEALTRANFCRFHLSGDSIPDSVVIAAR